MTLALVCALARSPIPRDSPTATCLGRLLTWLARGIGIGLNGLFSIAGLGRLGIVLAGLLAWLSALALTLLTLTLALPLPLVGLVTGLPTLAGLPAGLLSGAVGRLSRGLLPGVLARRIGLGLLGVLPVRRRRLGLSPGLSARLRLGLLGLPARLRFARLRTGGLAV